MCFICTGFGIGYRNIGSIGVGFLIKELRLKRETEKLKINFDFFKALDFVHPSMFVCLGEVSINGTVEVSEASQSSHCETLGEGL